MRVKDLKAQLAKMDDDCMVVVPDFDHSYRLVAHASDATAGVTPDGYMGEWAGSKHASPDERPTRVLVIT